jgi:NADPH:quinone reductase-like Zn-dependent oxidoreductase
MGRMSTSRLETAIAQKQMGAWAIERFGDPRRERSLLSLEKLPVPKVEARDVLIRMYGAEIGDWDALVASGEWSVERSFPITLGLAGSGAVVAVGKDVVGLERGDLVYTYSHPHHHRGCRSQDHNGSWADYMLVPFRRVALAPKSLDLTHAGAAPIVGLTAYETIIEILKVERHDVVLITAAAGGTGHLAVQIAARRGAHVVATARSENHEFLRGLGAELLIDYTREDFAKAARKRYREGVDKALNGVGGETANKVLQAVRPQGHVVDLTGTATKSLLPEGRVDTDYVVRPDRARLTALALMFDSGELKLEVEHPVSFSRAPAGLAEVLAKRVRGVLVLQIP